MSLDILTLKKSRSYTDKKTTTNVLYQPYFNKFPTQSVNASSFFKPDGKYDLVAINTTSSVITLDSVPIEFGDNVELSFTVNVDKTENFSALVGFTLDNSATANRFQFGYDSNNGKIQFLTGTTFTDILQAEEIVDGEYTFVFKKDHEGNFMLTVNDTEYNIRDYIPTFSFNYNMVRLRLRTATLGLKLSALKVTTDNFERSNILKSGLRQLSNKGKIEGRQVHAYQFGGKGNDWCFVRTPDNYDPNGKPHPFIIANHGNGFVMNGGLAYQNWTRKTQYGFDTQNDGAYLDTNDPYYVEHSNPTIEKFLEAGYIVCGAQNYGDLLYGNEKCRQACVDFYFHMINSFNVEEKCYMIGASNGFMTTLNAVRLLGIGRVRAIIGQYPLINLQHAYTNDFPGGVQNAYNISTLGDVGEFLIKTVTHDPMLADTIEISAAKQKITILPPTKIWWSSTDAAVTMTENAVAFKTLLDNSTGCYLEDVQIDADLTPREHGHWEHFDPDAYLEFFERYR